VGLGRLYWGKHWPSDVVGSLVIGTVAAWIGWRVAPTLLRRLPFGGRAPALPPVRRERPD
jgi:membrane-associated phospholipid phosphatase